MIRTFFEEGWQRLARGLVAIGTAGALTVAMRPSAGAPGSEASPYRVAGQYMEVCTCDGVCESALENGGRWRCAFLATLRVDAGQRGETPLGGRAVALVASPAGAARGAEEKTPAVSVFVDPRCTPQQVVALVALATDRFGQRFATPLPAARAAEIRLERTSEVLGLEVEGVAAIRGRPLFGGYHRLVQIQNAPAAPFSVLFLGRGTGGQIADAATGVRFDAEGRSMLYGKFDFASGPPGRGRR